MMARFGGWSEYRQAPKRIVEEQIQAWIARVNAEAEASKDQPSNT
jgi:hypothetical protein